jgi:hypothetical protein
MWRDALDGLVAFDDTGDLGGSRRRPCCCGATAMRWCRTRSRSALRPRSPIPGCSATRRPATACTGNARSGSPSASTPTCGMVNPGRTALAECRLVDWSCSCRAARPTTWPAVPRPVCPPAAATSENDRLRFQGLSSRGTCPADTMLPLRAYRRAACLPACSALCCWLAANRTGQLDQDIGPEVEHLVRDQPDRLPPEPHGYLMLSRGPRLPHAAALP